MKNVFSIRLVNGTKIVRVTANDFLFDYRMADLADGGFTPVDFKLPAYELGVTPKALRVEAIAFARENGGK